MANLPVRCSCAGCGVRKLINELHLVGGKTFCLECERRLAQETQQRKEAEPLDELEIVDEPEELEELEELPPTKSQKAALPGNRLRKTRPEEVDEKRERARPPRRARHSYEETDRLRFREEDEAPSRKRRAAEDEEPEEEPRPRKKKKKKKKVIYGFWPLIVFTPIGLLILCLAPFSSLSRFVAGAGAIYTIVVLITAFIRVVQIGELKAEAGDHLDDVSQDRHGGFALVVLSIIYGFRWPRLFACWGFLQVLALVVMIVSMIVKPPGR